MPNFRHINIHNLAFGARVVKYDTPKILTFKIVIFRSITSIIQYVEHEIGFFGHCIVIDGFSLALFLEDIRKQNKLR